MPRCAAPESDGHAAIASVGDVIHRDYLLRRTQPIRRESELIAGAGVRGRFRSVSAILNTTVFATLVSIGAKIVKVFSFVLALATSPLIFSQSGDWALLTAEQRSLNLQSLEKIWTTVRDKHWDPAIGGGDWSSAHKAALLDLQNAKTMEQSRAIMSEMLSKLGQSHFAVIPSYLYTEIEPTRNRGSKQTSHSRPGSGVSADPKRREEQCGVGLEAAYIDGKARVVALDRESPAARAGIRLGWELVSVDGFDIASSLKLLANTELREREIYERGMLEAAFQGAEDETVEAVFLDGDGKTRKVTLDRMAPKGSLAQFGFLPQTRVWIETKQLDGPIGYVRFNLFFDPEQLMPAFEKAVRECGKCQGFVIDLRGNPGGIGAMSMGLAGWFVPRKGRKLGTMKARDYSVEFEINPRVNAFGQPLAVLVDGASASTSEILAAGLQDLGRARVFGTKTAGAALPSMVIRLPNSDGFQYAEATYTSYRGQVLEGVGVTPDVLVKHSRESLLAQRDAPLDAAVEWIKMEFNKPQN